jgi:hypothetical protein
MSIQPRSISRSEKGTPIISEMTIAGSGAAKARTKSTGRGWATIPSISSSTIRSTWGRSSSTLRTVNARATSRRTRVCSGASRLIIKYGFRRTGRNTATPGSLVAARLNTGSDKTRFTSS